MSRKHTSEHESVFILCRAIIKLLPLSIFPFVPFCLVYPLHREDFTRTFRCFYISSKEEERRGANGTRKKARVRSPTSFISSSDLVCFSLDGLAMKRQCTNLVVIACICCSQELNKILVLVLRSFAFSNESYKLDA